MNTPHTASARAEAAADRFAQRITHRLTEGTSDLPYDITERLRASRMQALSQRKRVSAPVRIASPVVVTSGNSAVLGGDNDKRSGWWNALVSAIPLTALMVGLVFISITQDESSALDVAEVDSALLIDDLPPAAYADPGFVQFLKTSAQPN